MPTHIIIDDENFIVPDEIFVTDILEVIESSGYKLTIEGEYVWARKDIPLSSNTPKLDMNGGLPKRQDMHSLEILTQ